MYLREFTSSDAAPTPVGFVVTGHEPPMTINLMRGRFSPEDRPFITQAALMSDFLNIYEDNLVTRFNAQLQQMLAPRPVEEMIETPTTCPPDYLVTFLSVTSVLSTSPSPSQLSTRNKDLFCSLCSQFGHSSSVCIRTFRSGNPQTAMVDRLKRAMSIGKVEILMSSVAKSTRSRYKAGWVAWRDFCKGLEISHRLDPSAPDWNSSLLDFFTRGRKIMGGWILGFSNANAIVFHSIRSPN